MHSTASDIAPRHLVFASAPKLPSSEKSEKDEVESASGKEQRSRWLIDPQYTSIADFRRQPGAAMALRCASLHVPDRVVNEADLLIAATALVHGLSVVTRNTNDFQSSGVALINPWAD